MPKTRPPNLTDVTRPAFLPASDHSSVPASTIPESWDWRQRAQLIPVQDQGECGSCWAYSTVGMLADRTAIARRTAAVPLSVETVKSCTTAAVGDRMQSALAGTDGWTRQLGDCSRGGFIAAGCWFAEENGVPPAACVKTPGITRAFGIDRPCPTPERLEACTTFYSFAKGTTAVVTRGPNGESYGIDEAECAPPCTLPKDVIAANVANMQKDIMLHGPLAIGYVCYRDMLAGGFSDATYKDGVYRVDTSSGVDGGHAVVIVGWGQSGDTPYWIVRNSWGAGWNGDGYWKHLRGVNDSGIESSAVSAQALGANELQPGPYTGPAPFYPTWEDTPWGTWLIVNWSTLQPYVLALTALLLGAALWLAVR